MEEFEQEIHRFEQSLASSFKAKLQTMEALLANKDDQLAQTKNQLAELQNKFDHNLLVIKERDSDLQDIESQFQQSLELARQASRKHEQDQQGWMDRVSIMERELASKNLEIKDLADKLKEARREIGYYKKGYLEEVNSYKTALKQRDDDVEALKREVERVRREEVAAIESRFEIVIQQNKELCARTIDEANQTAQKQRESDLLALQNKESLVVQLKSEIDKLQTSISGLQADSQQHQKTAASLEATITSLTSDWHQRELSFCSKIAVQEEKLRSLEADKREATDQLKSSKQKAVRKLQAIEDDWTTRVESLVVEYRAEIDDKSKELARTTEENRRYKEDLARLSEKLKESERHSRNAAEELEILIREKDRETNEEIHKLKNQLEVASYREKDALVKAEKLEERNKKLNDELGKERVRALDLEKETQILIEQLVSIKEEFKLLKTNGISPGTAPAGLDGRKTIENRQSVNQKDDKKGGQGKVNDEPRDSHDPLLDEFDVQIPSNLLDSRFAKISKLIRSNDLLLKSQKKSPSSLNECDAELVRENEDLREMIAALKDDMLNAQMQVDTAFKANDALKDRYNELLEKYEAAVSEAMDQKEKAISLKTQLTGLHNDVQRNQSSFEGIRQDKVRLLEELKEEKTKYEEKEAKFRELQAHLEETLVSVTAERDELIRTLSRTKAKLNRVEDSVGKKDTSKLDIYLAEIDRLMIEKEGLLEQLNAKNLEIDRLRKNLDNQIHRMPGKRDNTREKQMNLKGDVDTRKKGVRNFNMKDDEEFAKFFD